jgi:hypothetical protein
MVLVESSDRLARDLIVAEVVIREFQKVDVRVVAASGGIDLTAGDDSNPTAKLVRQILAAVSEFDRCVISLKLRAAKDRMKARGEKAEGRKAFGENPDEGDCRCAQPGRRADPHGRDVEGRHCWEDSGESRSRTPRVNGALCRKSSSMVV